MSSPEEIASIRESFDQVSSIESTDFFACAVLAW